MKDCKLCNGEAYKNYLAYNTKETEVIQKSYEDCGILGTIINGLIFRINPDDNDKFSLVTYTASNMNGRSITTSKLIIKYCPLCGRELDD